MKYYHESQSWEKAHVEKTDKWERSKGFNLRVYSVSKSKTEPGKQREQFKKWREPSQVVFKMMKWEQQKLVYYSQNWAKIITFSLRYVNLKS